MITITVTHEQAQTIIDACNDRDTQIREDLDVLDVADDTTASLVEAAAEYAAAADAVERQLADAAIGSVVETDIRTYLDTSTGHVSREELDAIAAGPFTAYPHTNGAFVHVPPASDFLMEEEISDEDKAEFPNLIALITHAQTLEVSWVNLDSDGRALDALPIVYND